MTRLDAGGLLKRCCVVCVGVIKVDDVIVRLHDSNNAAADSTLMLCLVVLLGVIILLSLLLGVCLHCRHYKLHSSSGPLSSVGLSHNDDDDDDDDASTRHVILAIRAELMAGGCSGLVVEYRTRNQEVASSTHTRSTASNLEQVANLLCTQANSAYYPQRDGK